jgi:hypothetical protein
VWNYSGNQDKPSPTNDRRVNILLRLTGWKKHRVINFKKVLTTYEINSYIFPPMSYRKMLTNVFLTAFLV